MTELFITYWKQLHQEHLQIQNGWFLDFQLKYWTPLLSIFNALKDIKCGLIHALKTTWWRAISNLFKQIFFKDNFLSTYRLKWRLVQWSVANYTQPKCYMSWQANILLICCKIFIQYSPSQAKILVNCCKICICYIYGLTSEKFAELLRNVHAIKGLVMQTVCSSESGFSIQIERIVT